MPAYYNEIEPYAVQWLRNLMDAGLIAKGFVDERSIVDVRPADLAGYDQCHFFAGVAGWTLALQLAGWGDRPVWTGSCPCQPFSDAGKRLGDKDPRHLWPAWLRLIRECRPDCLFGEQVAGAIGRGWLDGISADLEAEGYAVGAVVLGAHSVGAPHIRQRLWWVAHTAGDLRRASRHGGRESSDGAGGNGGVADAKCSGLLGARADQREHLETGRPGRPTADDQRQSGERCGRESGGLGNTSTSGLQGYRPELSRRGGEQQSAESGFWSDYILLPCRDGKARRTEPGVCPLADGVPGRVGQLRAYGNAIVPQVAAEFVRAFMETKLNPSPVT